MRRGVDVAGGAVMEGEVGANGDNSLDRDTGVIGNDDVVACVGYISVVAKVGPVRKKVAGGARVHANVRVNIVGSSFTATGL